MHAPIETAPPQEPAEAAPTVALRRPRLRLIIGGVALLLFGFWLGARLGPLTIMAPGAGLSQGTWLPTPVPARAYIGGAVRRPGLYPLLPNARLNGLLRQAGGSACGADLARLSLASTVHDGESVTIPRRRGAGCAR